MNRRGFFGRLLGAAVAAKVTDTTPDNPYATNPVFDTIGPDFQIPLTWKGRPFVLDPLCPPDRIYFFNNMTVTHGRRLGVVTDISE